MNPAHLASLPRCYHPSVDDPALGCGRFVGHADGYHDKTIDLAAPMPAAEIAKRTGIGAALQRFDDSEIGDAATTLEERPESVD